MRPKLNNNNRRELANLETEVSETDQAENVVLQYQPRICRLGALAGIEALVHREGRQLPSQEFLADAGAWALRETCRQQAAWLRSLGGQDLCRISLGITPQQFRQRDFVGTVRLALAEAGLEPAQLELEFPEYLLAEDIEETACRLHGLKALGVGVAVREFGARHTSPAWLQYFQVDTLKLDPRLLHDFDRGVGDAAVVRGIIAMAQSLGLQVVAGGVATEAQLSFLRRHGCDYYQGDLISEPLPAQVMLDLMREYSALSDPDIAYG